MLAQHKGPNVDEFRNCYDLVKEISSPIDKWIKFALSNRVHRIDLNFSYIKLWRSRRSRYYTLHSGVMGLSNALGFKSLENLSLKAINVIEYLLSNCPLLERLYPHFNSACIEKFKSCWIIFDVEILRGGDM